MNINSQSVIAVVRLGVALVVSLGAMAGIDIDGDAVANVVLAIASVGTLAWVWWKNNNVTQAAQEAQIVLNEIKQNEEN